MLVDHSITYPYIVLEDMLVRVNDLLFPADFVILNMDENLEVLGYQLYWEDPSWVLVEH
jgi:hypothetical protein